ncbi:amidohydrolase [Penicillium cf. viridicatum]|uniref:Peptidase M20 domain-containing protein 2 n=1 Tax=Penicillium cf. viridicatum TaxID=2972119 RepID=A0A9W9N5S8_9EURO|nr:amidohydrolase [Penicillium cf. viridicatum]
MEQSKTMNGHLEGIKSAMHKYDAELKKINHLIWSNPDLAFEEYEAHNNICAMFENLGHEGYKVRRSAYELETSFEIEYTHGSGGRVIAFNAEYDALPGIGHACGHNLIATSAIAAFLSTCETLKVLYANGPGFTVRLLGTPAEEMGGGKILMIKKGAYKDVFACLMLHPMSALPQDDIFLSIAAGLPGGFLATDDVTVTFTGKAAHAAAAPWEGINALDAVVAAYVNISLLRQQLMPSQRVHGKIVNGGDRPNIIPMLTSVEYCMRASSVHSLKDLRAKVAKCFVAAAIATGCQVKLEWGDDSYADLKINRPICETFVDTMQQMGHSAVFDMPEQEGILSGGSTDMGNVSYEVPGFHAMYVIPANGVNHTQDFTSGAGSSEAFERTIACASGIAAVACKILVDDDFAEQVERDFRMGLVALN